MNFDQLTYEIKKLKMQTNKIYIYGAGMYGRNLYHVLKKKNINIDGFIVTQSEPGMRVLGLPVFTAKNILAEDVGIVLGLSGKNVAEVKKYLTDNQVDMNKVIDGAAYVNGFAERSGFHGKPAVDITTMIGCRVMCKYCPQSLLLKKYFEKDKKRESRMSMDTFQQCLAHLPQECDIVFAGMAEPFLNENCTEMLTLACKSGKKVALYTTLEGLKAEEADEILKLPLQFVVLHVPDKFGYAKISLTKSYFETLEKFVNAKKKDGKPFVNMCNAQADPHEYAEKICSGKYEIYTALEDRAGNLENPDGKLIHSGRNKGSLSCNICGTELNSNVLLPDGTLLLCCMDYGMKHVLGNLKYSQYEEIMSGNEMSRIKQGLKGNEKIDILCRSCSSARTVNAV